MINQPEVWLRGPLDDMPDLLQPVAYALLQAREEVNTLMTGFPEVLLWEKPAELASVGFHLQHLTGIIDRLFTYSSGRQLNQQQLTALESEGKPGVEGHDVLALTNLFNLQVDKAIIQLSSTNAASLTEFRTVGRGQLPSTVIGLYVHAAEHSMRHLGQLLVTTKVLINRSKGGFT